jgi:hypothetical protein
LIRLGQTAPLQHLPDNSLEVRGVEGLGQDSVGTSRMASAAVPIELGAVMTTTGR